MFPLELIPGESVPFCQMSSDLCVFLSDVLGFLKCWWASFFPSHIELFFQPHWVTDIIVNNCVINILQQHRKNISFSQTGRTGKVLVAITYHWLPYDFGTLGRPLCSHLRLLPSPIALGLLDKFPRVCPLGWVSFWICMPFALLTLSFLLYLRKPDRVICLSLTSCGELEQVI